MSVKRATGLGLSEIRARATADVPVLDVEMFTNHWYDVGAQHLLTTLTEWQESGIGWSAVETADGGLDRDETLVTLDFLRNVIDSGVADDI